MLEEYLFPVLALIFVVLMLAMVGEKLKTSTPLFLVIAGLGISFIPGMPQVSLSPDIVFLLFLPPLLYAAAWNTSWRDFWGAKRAIGLLSFGLVLFTSTAVAFVSHALIPDFPLAYGFLLGAIISPPDAVAATSVLKGLNVPKRVNTILEGESLINDATSLIVFRFALAAIVTGQFSFGDAAGQFALVAVGGIAAGLLIGFIVYAVHRFLPTNASIDTALTLLSPYFMYISAEYFHCSGVLAVVAGGLFLSFHSKRIFNYNTRMQAYSVWEMLVFVLNSMVFILIGLQLPAIIQGLGSRSVGHAFMLASVISIVTIILRVVWVYPAAYLPRVLSKRIRGKETKPAANTVFLVAWSGMRGVVSLASALAVPLTLAGKDFPHRNLLLFITFIVILFTLVIQGGTLPLIIKKLKIEKDSSDDEEHSAEIKIRLAKVALNHLRENYAEEKEKVEAYQRIHERYERMIDVSRKKLDHNDHGESADFLPRYRNMLLEVLEKKRIELNSLYCAENYSEELLRTKERELDLEEARLNE